MPIADSSTVAAVSALRTLSEQTDFLAVMFTYSCGVAFQFPDDFKAQKFPGLVFCGVIRNSEREVPPRPRGPFRSIGKELTEARIFEWFTWKNGTPLSGAKPKSVMINFVKRRCELDQVEQNMTAAELLSRFNEGSVIWRIFFLHCWRPERFPIYDQHVDSQKIHAYLNEYIPFHARFGGFDSRSVDKALWAFGKFLSENDSPLVP